VFSTTPSPTLSAQARPDIPAYTDTNIFHPDRGGKVTLSFRPAGNGNASVKIFNLSGELLCTPFESAVQAGSWFKAVWDGRNNQGEVVASGVYFLSVRGAGIREIKQVVVLR
jgi:hypothetical protein